MSVSQNTPIVLEFPALDTVRCAAASTSCTQRFVVLNVVVQCVHHVYLLRRYERGGAAVPVDRDGAGRRQTAERRVESGGGDI